MFHQLRALVLPDDQNSITSILVGWLTITCKSPGDLVPSSNLCRHLYMCSTYSHRHIQINKNTHFYFKEISRFTFIRWALSCGRVCVITGIFGSGDYRGWQIYRKMVWNGTFKICDEVQRHEIQHSPVVKVHGRLMGQEDWTQDFAANLGNMTRSHFNKQTSTLKPQKQNKQNQKPIPLSLPGPIEVADVVGRALARHVWSPGFDF